MFLDVGYSKLIVVSYVGYSKLIIVSICRLF